MEIREHIEIVKKFYGDALYSKDAGKVTKSVEALIDYASHNIEEPLAVCANCGTEKNIRNSLGQLDCACGQQDMTKVKPIDKCPDRATELLRLILPMAKGYAYKNDVGSNVSYIQEAEQYLTINDTGKVAKKPFPEDLVRGEK